MTALSRCRVPDCFHHNTSRRMYRFDSSGEIGEPCGMPRCSSRLRVARPPRLRPRSIQDDRLRFARTCYDHLAGQLGVAIADALVARGYVVLTDDGGEVTDSGAHFLSVFGAESTSNSRSRRIFCRPCVDWSERRYHVAGFIGAEILRRCLEHGWLRRDRDTRALRVTSTGQTGLSEMFGISLNAVGRPF